MPASFSGVVSDASAVVKTEMSELLVDCISFDCNFLLYFWETVNNLLTRAATCDGSTLRLVCCAMIKMKIRPKAPTIPSIIMIILVFLSNP